MLKTMDSHHLDVKKASPQLTGRPGEVTINGSNFLLTTNILLIEPKSEPTEVLSEGLKTTRSKESSRSVLITNTMADPMHEFTIDENIELEIAQKMRDVYSSFESPYDSSHERRPDLPAYHPSFRKVEDLCARIMSSAETLLHEAEYQDSETYQLIDLIRTQKVIQYPKAQRIGMMGDSGVGKSYYETLYVAFLIRP